MCPTAVSYTHLDVYKRQHIDNCPFASSANHFDSDKFNEEAFSFDDAINNLFLVKMCIRDRDRVGRTAGAPVVLPRA